MKQTLLIASTNEGKIREITQTLEALPLSLIHLKDLAEKIPAPKEDEGSLIGNAIAKATAYGEKTGFLTLSDDTGLFIDALDGWPGVEVAKTRKNETDTFDMLLGRMRGIPRGERGATFRSVIVIYNPHTKAIFIAQGELRGEILETPDADGVAWGYNRLFYIPKFKKTYGAMTVKEKNSVSHRSKALHEIKYYLQNQFGGKHIVVPLGIVVKDGKIMMNLRNDPHNPKVHRKWEFPGGGVEMGEGIEECLKREAKEETGYEIEIVESLGNILTNEYYEEKKYHYQVYLLPYLCKIIGGSLNTRDEEVLESRWFPVDEAVAMPNQMPRNQILFAACAPKIKELIIHYHL